MKEEDLLKQFQRIFDAVRMSHPFGDETAARAAVALFRSPRPR